MNRPHAEPQRRLDADVERLFRRVHDHDDADARARLVEMHLGMAYGLAGRYTRGAEFSEDLRQVAALGLVKAVNRFDPDQGRTFSTFAVPTILGELKRHFRDHGWTLHVERSTKELVLKVRQTRKALEEAGEPITVPRLAAELNADPEDILEALQASDAQFALSYDAPAGDDANDGTVLTIQDRLATPEPGYQQIDDRDAFERASVHLDPRSRLVLELYYGQELKQAQIAERIGVSQMQVSRILRASLDQVREHIVSDDESPQP